MKILSAFLIVLTFFHLARGGSWGSEGAPEYRPDPKYSYKYRCEVEVSDQKRQAGNFFYLARRSIDFTGSFDGKDFKKTSTESSWELFEFDLKSKAPRPAHIRKYYDLEGVRLFLWVSAVSSEHGRDAELDLVGLDGIVAQRVPGSDFTATFRKSVRSVRSNAWHGLKMHSDLGSQDGLSLDLTMEASCKRLE